MESGFIIAKSHIFNILIDTLPCPCALLVLSDLIILIMLLSSNSSEERLPGTLMLLSNEVQWEAKKKQLKWFAFILKSEISSLLIRSEGITGISLPL